MLSRSYVMYGAIAAGGMASVRLGKLLGPGGFARRVAIKRLHPELAADPEIATAFADEARHAACVAHANVAAMLDVVSADGELLLVMEYVHGESLSRLLAASRMTRTAVPVPMVVTVLTDVLHGLHAAHEARDAAGDPLKLVHRDVSPQNVIVGVDGVARLVDFGIAKAMVRANLTRDGQLKGKLPYMAPEQILQRAIDHRVDVYAAGVILHEGLAGKRLFQADDEAALYQQIVEDRVLPPSHANPGVPAVLDAITMRALDRHPDRRFATAREMALALEAAVPRAPASAVADWVATSAREALAKRAALIAEMERDARGADGIGPSVRGPSASVLFRDASPELGPHHGAVSGHPLQAPGDPAPRAPAEPLAAPSPASARSADALLLPRAHRRRVALAAAAAVTIVSVGGIAVFARASSPREPAAVASAPVSSAVPSVSGLDGGPSPETAAAPPPAASPPPRITSPPPSAAGAAATARARLPASPRWCKVFDPEKRIYSLKAMQVAQCP